MAESTPESRADAPAPPRIARAGRHLSWPLATLVIVGLSLFLWLVVLGIISWLLR